MTNFVSNKEQQPREFTPMEQAVTDLVNKFGVNTSLGLDELLQVDQFVEKILTVRELLTAAKNEQLVKSTRLELINGAFDLTECVIRELGEKRLVDSLKALRQECASDFLKVAEEVKVG